MNPSLQYQTIADGVSVAPQLGAVALAEVAAAGFRSVINNRPDGEGGAGQPSGADIAAAAAAAGLRYVYLPVAPVVQTPEQIARFAQLLNELPKPILAFCRSGARSAKLYRAATGQ